MLTYRTPFVREQRQIRSRLTGLLTEGRKRLYANLSGGVTEDFLNNSSELIYLLRLLLSRALMRQGQTPIIFGLGSSRKGIGLALRSFVVRPAWSLASFTTAVKC